MADHGAQEAPRLVSNETRLLVNVFLVESEDSLVALKEDDRAGVVQLVVESFNYLLLQRDQLLFADADAPLVFN